MANNIYISLLEFVSHLDKVYGALNCLVTQNTNYIISLYTLLNNYARRTKTPTITEFKDLMFGKVESNKKVLVVSIVFDKKTLKKDLLLFLDELKSTENCKLINFNEKQKKIDFEISKKEYLHVNLK